MRNVLIVDNDLGFVFWLGEALSRANYQPWPACSVSDAITVVGSKHPVSLDLLIVNPSLPGASRLISHFRRSQTHLKVMALGLHDEKALSGIDARRERPTSADLSARQKWVRAIDRMFGGHERVA
jgi:hypothetical protein